MAGAIEYAANMLNNERLDTKKIIILISDGDPNDEDRSEAMMNWARSRIMEDTYSLVTVATVFINTHGGSISTKRAQEEIFMQKVADPGFYFGTSYELLAQTLINIDLCF